VLSAETRTKLSVRITIARITDFAKFQILFLTDAIPLRFFFMLFNVVQEIDLIQAAGKKYDKKNEVISAYFAKEKQESGARNTAGRGTGVARSGKRLQLGRRKKSKEVNAPLVVGTGREGRWAGVHANTAANSGRSDEEGSHLQGGGADFADDVENMFNGSGGAPPLAPRTAGGAAGRGSSGGGGGGMRGTPSRGRGVDSQLNAQGGIAVSKCTK
jgi:hypothetical protein